MKNWILLILLFTGCSGILIAQTGPAEKWNYHAGGSKSEQAVFVLECTDGGSLLVGSTSSNDGMVSGNHGSLDAWIVKRRANGTSEWQFCFGTSYNDRAMQAVEVNDGYVIVGQKDNDAWVFKISKTGGLIWEKTYPTGTLATSALFAIRKKSDGTFLVGGHINHNISGNAMIWNISSTGVLIHGLSFTIGYTIHEIRLTSDGNILIMGDYNEREEGCYPNSEVPCYSNLWLAKVTPSFQIIWSKYYGGSTCDLFVDGEMNANNEIYLLGRTYCKGNITGPNNIGGNWPDVQFTWLAKVNPNGVLQNAIIVSSNPFYLDHTADFYCVTTDCKGFPVIGGIGGGFLGTSPLIEKYHSDLSQIVWISETTLSQSDFRTLLDIQFTSEASYLACGKWNDGDDDYFILKTEKDPDCAGSGNKCQNITPLSCGQTYAGNTAGRNSAFGISDLGTCHSSANPFTAGDQLFEIYKPNNNGDLVITLFSTNIDHDIFLLSSCNPVQCLYKSTGSVSGNGNNIEIIRVNNAPAGYYYVLVDGSTTSQVGPFTLTVNCGLLDCGNAKPIECKQTLFNETTATGVNNVSLYCNPSNISDPGTGCTGKERVYTFLLNSSQTVTLQLTNIRDGNDDFEMFLFKDCNEDLCLESSTNPKGNNELISANLTAGRYYIVVDGWKDSEGAYDISVDWNCCTNPIEVYNCGYITYKYAGNGSDLKFTFTSNKSIANGKKWKVGNNEILTATGTSFTYNFPSPGEYVICFPYLNANNCLEYCCYRIWISNPFDCFLFDYRFNPTSNNYTFNLDIPGATNIVWKDDTGGGTIGGGPISNPVPAPPGGGCVEKTITVTYYLNGRWYICCRKIWICNPFDCLEFDYRFDLNSNGMVFQLNHASASHITWKDDTGGGDIGGGPISNPVPVPPNPGDCIERIISVKYFANGRWYLCCRRIWICNPFDCANITFQYNASAGGYIFQLTQQGASYTTWKDDTGGGDIGGGPISNPVPPPSGTPCVEKVISARYFYNGRWYICCKRFWLCDPKICAATIQTKVIPSGQVTLSVPGNFTQVLWFNQNTGALLGSGNSIQVSFPYGSSQEVCVQYNDQGRTYMCCKNLVIVKTDHLDELKASIELFPNPNDGHFYVTSENTNIRSSQVWVINSQGKIQTNVRINNLTDNSLQVETRPLSPGLYFIRLMLNGQVIYKKFEVFQ